MKSGHLTPGLCPAGHLKSASHQHWAPWLGLLGGARAAGQPPTPQGLWSGHDPMRWRVSIQLWPPSLGLPKREIQGRWQKSSEPINIIRP